MLQPNTKTNKRSIPARQPFKIIIEKHADGYVAYPLGLKGVVVGAGDSCDEAVVDGKPALHFHIAAFGRDVLEVEAPVLEAFVAEAEVIR